MSGKQAQSPSSPEFSQRWHLSLAVLLVTGLVSISGLAGTEVYTWKDENGVTHYTDSPPGHDKAKTIQVEEVYRPGTTDVYNAAPPAPGASPQAGAPSAAEQRREEMAKKRREAQAQQTEIDRMCQMHKDRLARVEPSRRVFYKDPATGEEVRLDDEKRVAMVEESKDFISKNCR
jgi:hypothetical protein